MYQQIYDDVVRLVSLGVLKPNTKLPPVRTLATQLGINPNTVKIAYEELERRGVIQTISTKGTFVTDNIEQTVQRAIDEKLVLLQKEVGELIKLGMSKEAIMKEIF